MTDRHWHALIGTHLNEESVNLNATPPIPTAHEARDMLLVVVNDLAKDFPFIAGFAEALAGLPAEECHALLKTAGFTVLTCSGSGEGECMQTVNREAEAMIKAWETKEALNAMVAIAGGLPPAYEQLIKTIVGGVVAAESDSDGTGFYL